MSPDIGLDNDGEAFMAIDYALLVALIALVAAGVATLIGPYLGMFSHTATKIDSAGV